MNYYTIHTETPTGIKLYLCYNQDLGYYLSDDYYNAQDIYREENAITSAEEWSERYGMKFEIRANK